MNDPEHGWSLTLTTERLVLRPLRPEDHEAWNAGMSGRWPKQHRHDPGRPDLSGCDARWFTALCRRQQQLARRDQVYIFGIFERASGRHLGSIDLATLRRADNQWANLGYSIHNQFWRRGFGREAVRAALVAGFQELGYHRIEAAIDLDNLPSIALARSVGMVAEGVRRGYFFEHGAWVDHLIFSALPPDLGLEEGPPRMPPLR